VSFLREFFRIAPKSASMPTDKPSWRAIPQASGGFGMLQDLERRRHERLPLVRPCKLYEPRSRKYIPALTEDLSRSGVLLHVPRILELVPGDLIYVGVALKRRQAVIPGDEMLPARVIRRLQSTSGQTIIAAEFEAGAAALPLAAAA
jgi:hypothetical protein